MDKVHTYKAFEEKMKKSLLKHKESITDENGCFRGNPNEMVLPDEYGKEQRKTPAMLYDGMEKTWNEIQESECKYKPHIHSFKHIASSQTACVNLFIPILTNANADEILRKSGVAPKDFDHIDKDSLYRGSQFEFGVGKLLEKNSGVVTDADVAIAYINKNKEKCLWPYS